MSVHLISVVVPVRGGAVVWVLYDCVQVYGLHCGGLSFVYRWKVWMKEYELMKVFIRDFSVVILVHCLDFSYTVFSFRLVGVDWIVCCSGGMTFCRC